MKTEDFVQGPCACSECHQAGVTELPQRRDPRSGAWLHGYHLRRWHEARAAFMTQARAAVGARGRHANGFEKLVGAGTAAQGGES